LKKTCTLCPEKAAWGVIDRFGFMHPGTLCPRHYAKWKQSEFDEYLIFLRLPDGEAITEKYESERDAARAAKMESDEAMLDNDWLYIQDRPAKTMAQIRAAAIADAIEGNGYNVTKAMRELNISRATMYRQIRRYGIQVKRSSSLKRGKE
jgi:DNA-binding NtrC family response regulator